MYSVRTEQINSSSLFTPQSPNVSTHIHRQQYKHDEATYTVGLVSANGANELS